MPLEIEVKLKVPEHEAVRRRLAEIGATRKGSVRETNIFFDRPDRSLRKADTGLRVRLTREPGAEAEGEVEELLTFKGPVKSDALRSREAFDVKVSPREQVIPLLLGLGFEQVLLFEKDRESWEMEGCLVELDTLPVFGKFVEIEGPSEEAVRGVQRRLGLGDTAEEQKSYSKMVGDYLRERGENALRFGP